MEQTVKSGWIEVITGSMFSGKSEELIRRLRRAQIARQRVQIFKPAIDDRYSDAQIVSHSEMKIPSENIGNSRQLAERVRALALRFEARGWRPPTAPSAADPRHGTRRCAGALSRSFGTAGAIAPREPRPPR